MLEFDEEFLKPQIRDGFFIDATMKSMWAASLEVLAKISVVCEKYGIQWYAAYGNLLGAIRHEGFVPWDDDIDIWVMRKEYNRLMEVLPKELPQGYVVQSALSERGYDQFHSCINNGSGVSIRAEWLQEYHGCPFTVAIDIFPLDYLPRDEGERKIQCELVGMMGRAAQLAGEFWHGSLAEDQKESAMEEILAAKECIEELCSYRFHQVYFEQEDWRMVSSDFWKCANYIAMMYQEKESDYIVEYWDYINNGKKFKKEWFGEVYSATYENLMLPIPCGYDEILKVIYGNYLVPSKNSATHEYPFYARQLRELRKIVRQREKEVDPNGEYKKNQSQKIFPANWEEMIKEKKVVLFEDGIPIYTEYGEAALQKLEEVLQTFQENQDRITLWWRPQTQMQTALGLMSQDLVERYNGIVQTYLAQGWGIYDVSADEEIAIEHSSAYYGEMNATVKRLKGKIPVMIEAIF